MSFGTGTIQGTYYQPDGVTPDRGYVDLIPNSESVIDSAGRKILSGRLKVKLGRPAQDGDDESLLEGGWCHNGHFAKVVPATDDASLVPQQGRRWIVSPKLDYQHLKAVPIEVPTGTVVDMAVATPAAEVAPTIAAFLTAEEYADLVGRVEELETTGTGGGSGGLSTVAADTDGVPYFNPAGIPGSNATILADTDGVPYFAIGA